MRVLLALRRSGPPYAKRPTELFRALLVTSGAMSKQVDRLERLKLVERRADSDEGRRPHIWLTRRRLSIVDAAVNAIARRAVIAPAMKRFTPRERQAVFQFCLQILEHLERDRPKR